MKSVIHRFIHGYLAMDSKPAFFYKTAAAAADFHPGY